MSFYELLETLCKDRGFKAVISDEVGNFIGVTKQTISHWKKSGKTPTGDSVVKVADAFHVSTDYLLGRTDDPTDYSDPDLLAALAGPQLDEFQGDAKKALALQRAIEEDVRKEKEAATQQGKGVLLYGQLDAMDKGVAEGFMQGLLAQSKYFQPDRKKRA
ncbi:MAG: helix-turn-helix transcriptional regulator [Clostridia bacterium]|nr:helix-turn-helix transcriptional regulator [Clostridia bacterium]